MMLIHIVLFKFLPSVSVAHRDRFIASLKTLRELPSVLSKRLIVGGPSITEPAERSKGFEIALISYHRDREALAEYQASPEHGQVTKELFWPYKEDLVRFDFEVGDHDEETVQEIIKGFSMRANSTSTSEEQ